MLSLRSLLVFAVVAGIAGCSSSPVEADAPRKNAPRFNTGQTLGSGHRDGGGNTTATVGISTMAADSGTTSALGGQTLGSGH